jgi:hypothetical protein
MAPKMYSTIFGILVRQNGEFSAYGIGLPLRVPAIHRRQHARLQRLVECQYCGKFLINQATLNQAFLVHDAVRECLHGYSKFPINGARVNPVLVSFGVVSSLLANLYLWGCMLRSVECDSPCNYSDS